MLDVIETNFKERDHIKNIVPDKTEDFMKRGCLFQKLPENYLEKIV